MEGLQGSHRLIWYFIGLFKVGVLLMFYLHTFKPVRPYPKQGLASTLQCICLDCGNFKWICDLFPLFFFTAQCRIRKVVVK